jgi:four helix bundle protein
MAIEKIQRKKTKMAFKIIPLATRRREGFERRTKKDFAHFLDLAKGSAGEVRSMLYLAEDRRYVDKSFAERLRVDYKDLSKSIGALASKLRSQN